MGNAESAHGTGSGMMMVGILAAPFTGGASVALAFAGAGVGIGLTAVHDISGNHVPTDEKNKAWVDGFVNGVGGGIRHIV